MNCFVSPILRRLNEAFSPQRHEGLGEHVLFFFAPETGAKKRGHAFRQGSIIQRTAAKRWRFPFSALSAEKGK
jgi:hypothetical protein